MQGSAIFRLSLLATPCYTFYHTIITARMRRVLSGTLCEAMPRSHEKKKQMAAMKESKQKLLAQE
jgi:hypothetical protein